MNARAALLLFATAACDGSVVTQPCVEGATEPCTCQGGGQGTRTCDTNGAYGACVCGTGGAGGGGAGGMGATGGAGASGGAGAAAGAGGCSPGATLACYDGPAGTLGVGVCAAGVSTCSADGSGFGPCVGQVLPGVENCALVADEDCDGQAPACPASWSLALGELGTALGGGAVAGTPDGGAVLAASFDGSPTLAGFPVSAVGRDAFVLKVGPGGQPEWLTVLAAPSSQDVLDVAVDPLTGTIAVVGPTQGAIDFGAGSVSPMDQGDGYVWLLDAAGQTLSGCLAGGTFQVLDAGFAVTWADGEVLVSGSYGGSDAVACGLPLDPPGLPEMRSYLLRLDAAGTPLWVKTLAPVLGYSKVSLFADGPEVVLTGATNSNVTDFGQPSPGPTDLIQVDVSAAGAFLPGALVVNAPDATVLEVRAAPTLAGPRLLAGRTLGGGSGLDLGFGVIPGQYFFFALVENGVVTDGVSLGQFDAFTGGLTVGPADAVAFSYGYSIQHTAFGTPMNPAGQRDMALIRMNGDLTGATVASYGAPGAFLQPIDQMTDASGGLWVLAGYSGAVDLGAGPLPANGQLVLHRFP